MNGETREYEIDTLAKNGTRTPVDLLTGQQAVISIAHKADERFDARLVVQAIHANK